MLWLFFPGDNDRGGVLDPESLRRMKNLSMMTSRLSLCRTKRMTEVSTKTAPSGNRKPSITVVI